MPENWVHITPQEVLKTNGIDNKDNDDFLKDAREIFPEVEQEDLEEAEELEKEKDDQRN